MHCSPTLQQSALLTHLREAKSLQCLFPFNLGNEAQSNGSFQINTSVSMAAAAAALFSLPILHLPAPHQSDQVNCEDLRLQVFLSHWFQSLGSWSSFSDRERHTGVELVSVLMRHGISCCYLFIFSEDYNIKNKNKDCPKKQTNKQKTHYVAFFRTISINALPQWW